MTEGLSVGEALIKITGCDLVVRVELVLRVDRAPPGSGSVSAYELDVGSDGGVATAVLVADGPAEGSSVRTLMPVPRAASCSSRVTNLSNSRFISSMKAWDEGPLTA
jgi:hypothetical protein